MKTPLEIYNNIYRARKAEFTISGLTEDKASRKANIIAVQTTWELYNAQYSNSIFK